MSANLLHIPAVYPLFNFQVSEVSVRKTCQGVFFDKHKEKLEQGFEVLSNVRIRRITEEELEEIKKLTVGLEVPPLDKKTFVIEALKCTEGTMTEIEEILLALRLYKSNDVFIRVLWDKKNGKISSFGILYSPIPSFFLSPYVLYLDEIREIRELASKINNINFEKRRSFRIACDRFSRSYGKDEADAKIIDLMISFEALFKEAKKPLSYTGEFIGLGCSMLLGKDYKERERISSFLVKAYEIRNDIVHGSEFGTPIQINNQNWAIKDFVSQLQEYLRESIKELM
jgi:hypothetical protein